MTVCLSCERELRDGARFCTGCGEPTEPADFAPAPGQAAAETVTALGGLPPGTGTAASSGPPSWQPPAAPRRSTGRNRATVWVAATAMLVVAGWAVFVVLRPSTTQTAPTLPAPAPGPPASSEQRGANQTAATTRVVTEADLQQQVDADRGVVEGLVGSWVPQLSSKRLGLTVHGVTYGYPEILADFQALHARFPRSVLIRSDDYSSYPPGYWVTVMAEPYASPDAANARCDANGIPAEDCYAHRVSHTDGRAGSSKTR